MNYPKAAALFIIFALLSSPLHSQWIQQTSNTTVQLTSVCFINPNTGIVCGAGGRILRTTNGGANWIVSIFPDTIVIYNSVCFPNSTTGYIAGRHFYVDSLAGITGIVPNILKTTNAGLNWFSVLTDTAFSLRSISFADANTGVATGGLFGNGPNIYLRTTNGGLTWQTLSTTDYGYLINANFVNNALGFMSTQQGIIYRTLNAGANWNSISNFQQVSYSTCFIDINTDFFPGGIVQGGADSNCSIYKTTNSGLNWSLVFNDTRGVMNKIVFANSLTGFAAGTNDSYIPNLNISARVLKTTNGGNNWFQDTSFTGVHNVNSIYFLDALTGYIVGGGGTIFKTFTGGNIIGVQQVGIEVPKTFNLSQNYPNPFNPSTKIKFALPKSAFTSIVVFDALGREITKIVSEELKAGNYEVSWNASEIPSGVYFYKISSGDFTQTKKMILLK